MPHLFADKIVSQTFEQNFHFNRLNCALKWINFRTAPKRIRHENWRRFCDLVCFSLAQPICIREARDPVALAITTENCILSFWLFAQVESSQASIGFVSPSPIDSSVKSFWDRKMKKTSAISIKIGIFQFRLLRSVSKAFLVSQLTQRSDRSLRIFGCHKTYMCSLGFGFANSPIATFIGMVCVVEQKSEARQYS